MLFTALIATLSLQACGQKLSADKVPAPVKEAFNKAHPGVKAKWEKEAANYEVSFKDAGKDASCLITAEGQILETEVDISAADLPGAAITYVQKKLNNAKIKEAAKITKADGTVLYEAEVNGKDYMFDDGGNFLNIAEEKKD